MAQPHSDNETFSFSSISSTLYSQASGKACETCGSYTEYTYTRQDHPMKKDKSLGRRFPRWELPTVKSRHMNMDTRHRDPEANRMHRVPRIWPFKPLLAEGVL